MRAAIVLSLSPLTGCASLGEAAKAGAEFAASEEGQAVRETTEAVVSATPAAGLSQPIAYLLTAAVGMGLYAAGKLQRRDTKNG